jgi:hypothetical protein
MTARYRALNSEGVPVVVCENDEPGTVMAMTGSMRMVIPPRRHAGRGKACQCKCPENARKQDIHRENCPHVKYSKSGVVLVSR